MPLRTQTWTQGAEDHAVSEVKSNRVPSPRGRGRGCGKTKGKGRGRGTRQDGERTPCGAMPNVVAKIRGVHRAVANLVGLMAEQRRVEVQPSVRPTSAI